MERVFSALAMIIEAVYGFRATTLVGAGVTSPSGPSLAFPPPSSASPPTSTAATQPQTPATHATNITPATRVTASSPQANTRQVPAVSPQDRPAPAANVPGGGGGGDVGVNSSLDGRGDGSKTRTPVSGSAASKGGGGDASGGGVRGMSGGKGLPSQQQHQMTDQVKRPTVASNRGNADSNSRAYQTGRGVQSHEQWPASAGVRKNSDSRTRDIKQRAPISSSSSDRARESSTGATPNSLPGTQHEQQKCTGTGETESQSQHQVRGKEPTETAEPQRSDQSAPSEGQAASAAGTPSPSRTAANASNSRPVATRAQQSSRGPSSSIGKLEHSGSGPNQQPENKASGAPAARGGGHSGQTVAERAQAAVEAARRERLKSEAGVAGKDRGNTQRNTETGRAETTVGCELSCVVGAVIFFFILLARGFSMCRAFRAAIHLLFVFSTLVVPSRPSFLCWSRIFSLEVEASFDRRRASHRVKGVTYMFTRLLSS